MTDDQGSEGEVIDLGVQIGVDGYGDPFVTVNITTPPGRGLTATQCDLLALKLLAAAAAARSRATIVQRQLLAGVPLADAVKFADEMLN